MSNLQLSLKTKWFEMTKAGIKTEDYREITPYWVKRLVWRFKELDYLQFDELVCHLQNPLHYFNSIYELEKFWNCEIAHFTQNTMTLGYPKTGDTERIIKYEHAGIEIREGNPDWGAEPGKLYFVIKHGKQI